MATNKNYAVISLMIGIVCFGTYGCAQIARQTYDSLRPPTDNELNVRIIKSSCNDLTWEPDKRRYNAKEFHKIIHVKRAESNMPNRECQIDCTGGERLSDEERKLKCYQLAEVEVERRKSEKEAEHAEYVRKKAIEKAETDEAYSFLASKGFTKMSFEDFQLDAESLPEGKGIVISGFFEVWGNLQYLVKYSSASIPQQYQIPLISDDSSREVRKQLIQLQERCFAGQSFCQLTIIGVVSRCNITFLSASKNKPCIKIIGITRQF